MQGVAQILINRKECMRRLDGGAGKKENGRLEVVGDKACAERGALGMRDVALQWWCSDSMWWS